MSQDADSHSQPKPVRDIRSRSVTDAVIADMQFRRGQGIQKYGTELLSHNGRDSLVDAYQEALDLAVYLKQCLMERAGQLTTSVDEALETRNRQLSLL